MGFAVVCVFDTHFLIYHQDRTLIIRDRGRGNQMAAASLPIPATQRQSTINTEAKYESGPQRPRDVSCGINHHLFSRLWGAPVVH